MPEITICNHVTACNRFFGGIYTFLTEGKIKRKKSGKFANVKNSGYTGYSGYKAPESLDL